MERMTEERPTLMERYEPRYSKQLRMAGMGSLHWALSESGGKAGDFHWKVREGLGVPIGSTLCSYPVTGNTGATGRMLELWDGEKMLVVQCRWRVSKWMQDKMAEKFIQKHRDASEIAVDKKTGLPVKAIYYGPGLTGNMRQESALYWFEGEEIL